jgi:hypothetical protein
VEKLCTLSEYISHKIYPPLVAELMPHEMPKTPRSSNACPPFANEFRRERSRGRATYAEVEEYGYSPPAAMPGTGMKRSSFDNIPYDAKYHRAGTRGAAGGCSWHGQTCHDDVIASVLTRDQGGDAWHAVCRRAPNTLRST